MPPLLVLWAALWCNAKRSESTATKPDIILWYIFMSKFSLLSIRVDQQFSLIRSEILSCFFLRWHHRKAFLLMDSRSLISFCLCGDHDCHCVFASMQVQGCHDWVVSGAWQPCVLENTPVGGTVPESPWTTLQELKLQGIKICDGVVFSWHSRAQWFATNLSDFGKLSKCLCSSVGRASGL